MVERKRQYWLYALQHPTTLCNTVQSSEALGNTLQHAATRCNTLQHSTQITWSSANGSIGGTTPSKNEDAATTHPSFPFFFG